MEKLTKEDILSSMLILGREGVDDFAFIRPDGTKIPYPPKEEIDRITEETIKKYGKLFTGKPCEPSEWTANYKDPEKL